MTNEQGSNETHKAVKLGAAVALGATAVVGIGGAFAFEAGAFDSGSTPDSGHVQTIPSTEQPDMIPGTQIPNPLKSSTPESTALPTFTPTIVETPSPTATHTPTTEHVVAPPCEIVPQEYCEDAKLIDFEFNGQHFKAIGFKLPSGVPVFAMAEGKILETTASGNPFNGSYATLIRNGSQAPITITGDFSFDKPSQSDVANGTQIGTMKETGIVNLGEFNLVFIPQLRNSDGKGFTSDDSLIAQMFPTKDLARPDGNVVSDGTGKTTYIKTYNDAPPPGK